jgi:hypothetical protein
MRTRAGRDRIGRKGCLGAGCGSIKLGIIDHKSVQRNIAGIPYQ